MSLTTTKSVCSNTTQQNAGLFANEFIVVGFTLKNNANNLNNRKIAHLKHNKLKLNHSDQWWRRQRLQHRNELGIKMIFHPQINKYLRFDFDINFKYFYFVWYFLFKYWLFGWESFLPLKLKLIFINFRFVE